MYKLIASDIDGTIMPRCEVASERTKKAVKAAEERGCKVILSTGRRMASAEVVANTFGIGQNPLISHCGAGISIPATSKVLKTVTIPSDVARRVFEIANTCDVKISIHQNPLIGRRVFLTPKYHFEGTLSSNSWYGTCCQELDMSDPSQLENPIQISLIGEGDGVEKAYKLIFNEFGNDLVYINYGRISFGYFVDIFAKGMSKASALKEIADELCIRPDEIVAFGDGSNDIEMLLYSGLPVVMGNSPDYLKEYAKIVAQTNENDGVAIVIEQLISNGMI